MICHLVFRSFLYVFQINFVSSVITFSRHLFDAFRPTSTSVVSTTLFPIYAVNFIGEKNCILFDFIRDSVSPYIAERQKTQIAMTSKAEYLKKYLSGGGDDDGEKKKKKKKKKKVAQGLGLKIIDDDADTKFTLNAEDEDKLVVNDGRVGLLGLHSRRW